MCNSTSNARFFLQDGEGKSRGQIAQQPKGGGNMKKYFSAIIFVIAYATLFSLGLECLLNLLGLSMAIALDGAAVTKQYPRFIPFCMIVGLGALILLIATFILNLKMSEKYGLTKKIWWIQSIFSLVISFPMVKVWELLFEFLQRTF